ncbi:MAG: hypothetical protein ABID63_13735 [Pseudomonadota bacterium]
MCKNRLRPLFSILIALSLIGGNMAAGKVQASGLHGSAPLTEIIICAANGEPAKILVDAQGILSDPQQDCGCPLCPDCLQTGTFYLTPADVVLWRKQPVFSPARTGQTDLVSQRHFSLASARAPPFPQKA